MDPKWLLLPRGDNPEEWEVAAPAQGIKVLQGKPVPRPQPGHQGDKAGLTEQSGQHGTARDMSRTGALAIAVTALEKVHRKSHNRARGQPRLTRAFWGMGSGLVEARAAARHKTALPVPEPWRKSGPHRHTEVRADRRS